MSLECFDIAAHKTCRFDGDLDLASADELLGTGMAAMDPHAPSLTIDLSGVTFMDCAGLSALVFLRTEAERRGGHLTLVRVPDQVLQVFRLTRLDLHFRVQGSAVLPHPR